MDALGAAATVVVPVCSGLAFLAYKHPREYRALAWRLGFILALVFVGGFVWAQGSLDAREAAFKSGVVPSDKFDQFTAAMDAVSLPSWGWWPFGAAFPFLYFSASLKDLIRVVRSRYDDAINDAPEKSETHLIDTAPPPSPRG